jgi:hypothetical protein
MTALSSLLLRLYPRAWRRRYGSEMQDLLSTGNLSLRTVADVIAGAIDARFNPQSTAINQPAISKGERTMTNAFRCHPAAVSRPDQWRSAAWLVGGSIVMTVIAIGLQVRLGKNSFSEALLYGAFPAALMLSSECTYLKPYSQRARVVMSVGGAAAIILMMWGAVAVANLI